MLQSFCSLVRKWRLFELCYFTRSILYLPLSLCFNDLIFTSNTTKLQIRSFITGSSDLTKLLKLKGMKTSFCGFLKTSRLYSLFSLLSFSSLFYLFRFAFVKNSILSSFEKNSRKVKRKAPRFNKYMLFKKSIENFDNYK